MATAGRRNADYKSDFKQDQWSLVMGFSIGISNSWAIDTGVSLNYAYGHFVILVNTAGWRVGHAERLPTWVHGEWNYTIRV
jgi:hypothetical protein